jgi:hypothetical protein
MIGAHGRTRTCIRLIRNQVLSPIELRVQCWCRDGDSNSGLPVESRRVLATRRSRRIGSPTRIRTWIDRLTIGRPAVGRSGNGGAPRTRTELNLLAREICGPCAYPDWVALGARPCSACNGAMARWVRPPRRHGAWGRFRAHLSAASARRFHQISFPGEFRIGAADGNRTHVCALATHGSAIELRTRKIGCGWCTEQDSNLRSPKAPGLQPGLVAA